MSKTIRIETHRGGFQIDPDQIAGCKPCILTGPDGKPMQATEVLISIGAIPGPPHMVMHALADQLEALTRPALVIPVVGQPRLPTGPGEGT